MVIPPISYSEMQASLRCISSLSLCHQTRTAWLELENPLRRFSFYLVGAGWQLGPSWGRWWVVTGIELWNSHWLLVWWYDLSLPQVLLLWWHLPLGPHKDQGGWEGSILGSWTPQTVSWANFSFKSRVAFLEHFVRVFAKYEYRVVFL